MLLLTLVVPPVVFIGLVAKHGGNAREEFSRSLAKATDELGRTVDTTPGEAAPSHTTDDVARPPVRGAGVRAADFDKVVFEPEKYKGQTLRSTVQITYAMPMPGQSYVLVHGVGLSRDQALSCSKQVAEKAMRALATKGQHGVVTIDYRATDPSKVPLEKRRAIHDSGIEMLDISL